MPERKQEDITNKEKILGAAYTADIYAAYVIDENNNRIFSADREVEEPK